MQMVQIEKDAIKVYHAPYFLRLKRFRDGVFVCPVEAVITPRIGATIGRDWLPDTIVFGICRRKQIVWRRCSFHHSKARKMIHTSEVDAFHGSTWPAPLSNSFARVEPTSSTKSFNQNRVLTSDHASNTRCWYSFRFLLSRPSTR
jgi:hypothetical protein